LKYFVTGPFKAPLEGAWRPDFMACIAYTDDAFENIFSAIKANGLLENSIIVVATDHGSGYELDKFDGGFQYNDYTRMTWLVHVPPQVRRKFNIPDDVRRVSTWLSAINVAPTLCEMAGVPQGRGFAGRSFVELLRHRQQEMFDDEIWCFGRK
jgi:uncharacterized sulfatase